MNPLPALEVPQSPWTYDLEIAFFRAIISYRPIGLHKHLRLVSILNLVNKQIPASETPLTLNDITTKLDKLYNIKGIEEQEESEEGISEKEFDFPFQDFVGIIEERGKCIDGDGSVPSSPEAVMSVRSGRSGGRGTKRRREESTAVSITDAGSEEEGILERKWN